ncbi:MAG TPA: HNH endonuclease [Xanthobacteraceae bacterium]|nr:HNH endonuclease [Xanthobacteraceae bacterium]
MSKITFSADGRGLPKSRGAERRTRPIKIYPGLPERFWQKVDKSGGPNACWLWKGKPQNGGYGVIHRGGAHSDTVYAHRLSYLLATGRDPVGWCVCHRCDVPGCVNPLHLFLGTSADNTRDMIAKGRKALVRPSTNGGLCGERIGSAKLTADKVRDIRRRARAGETSGQLGVAFGVDSSTIRQIVRGEIWRHVGEVA